MGQEFYNSFLAVAFHQSYSLEALVAPYRAILRYYRCDTPYRAIPFKGGKRSPKMVRYPPWYLVSYRHICAIPHFATYRAVIVRYPTKTSTKEFCDTIARSIARYEKYRCWASKLEAAGELFGKQYLDNQSQKLPFRIHSDYFSADDIVW